MIRKCKLCGQEFESTGVTKYCKRVHTHDCEVCGKTFVIKDVHFPDRCCSEACRRILRRDNARKTSLEKYGVTNAGFSEASQEKIKKHNLEKYGVEWSFQADEVKAKIAATCTERYGTPSAMQSPEIKEKAKQTCLERYGATSSLAGMKAEINIRNLKKYGTTDPGNLPEFREKSRQTQIAKYGKPYYTQTEEYKEKYTKTCLEKYGVPHASKAPEVIAHQRAAVEKRFGTYSVMLDPTVREKIMQKNIDKYGVPWACMLPQCIDAQGARVSKINKAFGARLEDVGFEIEYEFNIGAKSYDIHIKNTNILIEIDPTYTHTTAPTKYGSVKSDYHATKVKIAKEAGYRCIHVFDWDDWDKIISLLVTHKKLGARKCEIVTVDKENCDTFLAANHLQGPCRGQQVMLGLKHGDELVEVMTFGKARYNKHFEWELLRLCTVSGYAVQGGASKLFNYFITNYNPESIVSYCDNAKFSGQSYIKLGFQLGDIGTPSKHWSKNRDHITHNLLCQRGYDQLFGTSYGKGTRNEQLMLEHGWWPIYDCGQSRYEWRKSN